MATRGDKVDRIVLISPSDLHLLSSPSHPCFLIKDGFLGSEAASEVAMEARSFQREGKLKPAGMSRREWVNEEYRGDEMAWLSATRSGTGVEKGEGNTIAAGPAMRRLLSRIERLCKRMDALDRSSSSGPLLGLECNQKSAQLAYYPGKGKRYVRHCDSFADSPGETHRCLTCIYYLNVDWEESQGGQLRLYLPDGEGRDGGMWDQVVCCGFVYAKS